MKKAITLALILLLILVAPIPTGTAKDGGTKTYTALTYKIVKWHRLYDDGKVYDETKIYFSPDNFLSLDELFEGEHSNSETIF